MPRLANLTTFDPDALQAKLLDHCNAGALARFLGKPWSMAYGEDTQMDTFDLQGMPPLLPIESEGSYAPVFCKFANVAPHRDTHDDEYYILYVVSGQARLHVGCRKTESMDLTPGMCVLFNCDATHWSEGDADNPVQVIIGGVSRARGRKILNSTNPNAAFQMLMTEGRVAQ